MQKEKREYVLVSGHGIGATRADVTVECVAQCGKFYASLPTQIASPVGIGSTPDEAFDAWRNAYGHDGRIFAHAKQGCYA